jgi:hypothetical protein
MAGGFLIGYVVEQGRIPSHSSRALNVSKRIELPEPIFNWATLREIGRHELRYQNGTVPGKMLVVELTGGPEVRAWRADNGQEYFCHGLTFGGKEAPGGAISPFSDHVPTILRMLFEGIPEGVAAAEDILVWTDAATDDVIHSAILADCVMSLGARRLDDAAMLQTKNGIEPETTMTLGKLVDRYGASYSAFRRKP